MTQDEATGRTITRWTASPARDNHLYFTSHSVTVDDRWLVFLSERVGRVNLFAIERSSGEILRVSDNRFGVLGSYCWPWGGSLGLSKSSPVLDERHNRLFWIQDGAVWRADLDALSGGARSGPKLRKVWDLPAGWWTSFNHVSPDGRTLCVPLAHPDAWVASPGQGGQLKAVPHVMKAAGVGSQIWLIDVETGEGNVAADVPFWVTHVQFDPAGSGRIIFNQEGVRLHGRSRIWRLEPGGGYEPLFDEPETDMLSHENWAFDGSAIVYHGHRADAPIEPFGVNRGNTPRTPLIAARRWDGSLVFEWLIPDHPVAHTTPTVDGHGFVTDGGDTIAIFRAGQNADAPPMREVLCHHRAEGSRSLDQDDHVHPLTAPHGRSIVYASNVAGTADVYEVSIESA